MATKVPPQLLQLMCDYYPDSDRARVLMNSLSIPTDYLDFSGPPKTMWFKLLAEAGKHTTFLAVFQQVKQDFPNLDWANVEPVILAPLSTIAPFAIPPESWKGSTTGTVLEKIIGKQSTLLPISFLENGIDASRSVAKVQIPGVGSGSGFLIERNVFLTNNHVLDCESTAASAEALFNYQITREGRDGTVATFKFSPDDLFITSKEDDWTAVRVVGDANANWGQLMFAKAPAEKDQHVNIIQHPGGQPKQIAIYNNLVQFADRTCVQYLTDTMNGSSGSPVFNSSWEVVALHRAGGMLREPNSPSTRQYFRNEGTPIELIRNRLVDEGVIS
ncbi:Glutamyl endopeptidase precursor [Pirellula sp. SH-Sr6A]|uniref:trypsin-like serine peptidase n=1 Tax=Pirellula sp. SH-Sr6A TaxID=1632865 RepID=UPI00078C72B6|nr:serine protease [Pirellula sp. SH-Sr6A]AMV35123.1 Glutamyl endopeptidase precursor [Pirellula sp. SH-Sr6A]